MVSPIESLSTGLAQMFFQNRFAPPKEAPLSSLRNLRTDENSSSAESAQNQQHAGLEQANFSQALQQAAQSRTDTKQLQKTKAREPRNESYARENSDAAVQSDPYAYLNIKAHYNLLYWS